MPTIVEKTISLTGTPDYSTLQTWEDAAPVDLVVADQVWRGVIQEATDNFTARLVVSGSTTDATRYKELTVKAGSSFIDHADVLTNPLRFDSSKGASITRNDAGTSAQAIASVENYFRVSRLQMAIVNALGEADVLSSSTSNLGVIVDQCILESSTPLSRATSISGAGSLIKNSLVVSRASGITNIVSLASSGSAYNCTFVVPSDITEATTGVICSTTTTDPVIVNCAVFGATNTTSGACAATTCYTDSVNPPVGFTTVDYDTTTGSGFEDTTDATRDFRLKETSALVDAGTRLPSLAGTDIIDKTRPIKAGYDVGAFEYGVEGDTAPVSVFDEAILKAPLKTSLLLDKGVGNPTYARATTASVIDNNGRLLTVPSGAARFSGARLIYNRISTTVNFTGGTWNNFGSPTVTAGQADIDGGTGATIITATANSTTLTRDISTVAISADTLDRGWGFWFKSGTQAWFKMQIGTANEASSARVWFNAQTGVIGTSSTNGGMTVLSSGITPHPTLADWYFIYMSARASIADAGLAHIPQLWWQDADGSFAETAILDGSITLYKPQFIVLSANTSKALSSDDFVSTGISAPYHGAGIDGVKWFGNDVDGNTINDADLSGFLNEPAATNSCLHSEDATDATWVKTNVTAAKDQTGVDNIPLSASKLTATAGNGTCLQTITMAAAARTSSAYVKRITGTGTVEMTRDGGTSWTDITSDINSSTYSRVAIRGTSVTNPQVGFRIVTSGDAIAFQYFQDEAGSFVTSGIKTTTAAVTRNADALTYQTSNNFSDTAGAISVKVTPIDGWGNVSGNIGSSTTGLATSTANEGVQAKDGTNTVNGPTGTPTNQEQLTINWSGAELKAASGGVLGTAGSYDGAFGLTNISVEAQGNIRNLYVWTSALSDSQIQTVSGGIWPGSLMLMGVGF